MSWPIRKFATLVADIKNALVGGPFGSKLTTRDYVDEGVPVIRGANMSNGRFILEDDFVFVTDEKKRKDLQSNLARPGDLIFTQRGTLGQVAIIPHDASYGEFIVSQSQMKATLDPEKADTAFYYYFFSSQKVVDTILNMTSSSGVPHINLGTLKDFEVPVPPLPTQKRIAGILSAYDDLIENNRRRIGLLEQAARLLHREWFVHLRFPGHETAKIVDGLPEGWERATLGQVADEVDYGFTASASLDVDGPRFLRITDIVSGAINWHQVPRCEIPEGRLKKFSLKEGDVVVARTGATTGWARRIGELAEQAVFASYLVRFRFGQRIDPMLAATFMESDLYKTTIQGRLGGAAQPNASAKVLAGVEIAVPPRDLQDDFKRQISKTNGFVDLLVKENAKLTRARDLLLPRLMDGRIPV